MELSKRLKTIADMVTPGNRTADVGCDHGFVSIYLYREKIAPRVYAMDVRTGPLARAKEHIESYGLSEYIETRLSDGLTALAPGEAETIICAGMGGRLMAKILLEGDEKVRAAKELILEPQSEIRFFREFLRTHGLLIIQEDLIKEDGKFYPVIKAVPHPVSEGNDQTGDKSVEKRGAGPEEIPQRLADAFGPCLLAKKHPVLREYLEILKARNQSILAGLEAQAAKDVAAPEKTVRRKRELWEELADIEQGLLLCGAAQR
ncbi:MAG: tRNA (adenine(22)-N(1))-methyltransferase [Lachnospiraceae bacterium]